jgi:6-phosphogluconolactonase
MPSKNIYIFAQNEEAIESLFNWWQNQTKKDASQHSSISWALSGGNTPLNLYKKLANTDDLPWNQLQVFLVDERDVDISVPESNYNQCLKSFKQRLNEEQFPSMREIPLQKGVDLYEKKINALESSRLNLVLLGMGSDGHTASLFPGTKEGDRSLDEFSWQKGPLVLCHELPQQPIASLKSKWRVTLSFKALIEAENVVFLITGQEKAKALCEVFKNNESNLPAAKLWRLRQKLGLNTYWFLDAAAAKEIIQ